MKPIIQKKHLKLIHSTGVLRTPLNGNSVQAQHHLLETLLADNSKLKIQYETLVEQTVQALLQCLECRDGYTFGHCQRVKEYALLVGNAAEISPHETRKLELCALFHDLGKIGVADCVLLKPGKFENGEQEDMRSHPVIGANIIGLIDAFKELVPGIRHHHERVDGKGYPSGLKGSEIPIEARILLVVDAFDAMTSTRPYRKALSVDYAYEELNRHAGSQFDPEFVRLFLQEHKKLQHKAHGKIHKARLKNLKKAA